MTLEPRSHLSVASRAPLMSPGKDTQPGQGLEWRVGSHLPWTPDEWALRVGRGTGLFLCFVPMAPARKEDCGGKPVLPGMAIGSQKRLSAYLSFPPGTRRQESGYVSTGPTV